MKNLGKLNINNEKLMKNNELQALKGGEGTYPTCTGGKKLYECSCGTGCIGTWLDCYSTIDEAIADIPNWCGCPGGECHTNTQPPIEG